MLTEAARQSCAPPALRAQLPARLKHVSEEIVFAYGQGNCMEELKKSIKKLFVYKHPGQAHVQQELPDEGGGGARSSETPFPPAARAAH